MPVIYLPVNHGFCRHDIALIEESKEQALEHIRVLNDDQVVIDGVRFIGSIRWHYFGLFGELGKLFAIQQVRQRMTDFSIIRNNGRRFCPEDLSGCIKQAGLCWR